MQHGKQLRPTAATDEGGDRNGKLLWRNFSEGELGNTTYHQVSIQILDVKVAFIFWTLPVYHAGHNENIMDPDKMLLFQDG